MLVNMGDPHKVGSRTSYPHSLPAQGCNVYGYDFDAYLEQLDDESDRLFVPGPDIHLKIIEVHSQYHREHTLLKPQDLKPYLEQPRPNGLVRLILIPQESSWGKLRVTRESMLSILDALQVFPSFIDVLRAFGQRTTNQDESYSGVYLQENENPVYSECAYTVKYAERHGRDEPSDPWSIRQMGVYRQCYEKESNIFIIVHPSRAFLKRLKRSSQTAVAVTPWDIHMMALSAAMDNWRWYISDLETRYTNAKTRTQLSSVTAHQSRDYLAQVTFEDTQDIQVLQDKLSQSLHFLTTNHTTITHVCGNTQHLTSMEESFVRTLVTRATSEVNRVKSLLSRAEGTQALAQAMLDFTCLESMRSNSRTMTELTKSSQREAEMLLDLSMKASRDNDILKTLALLGLIYLPATLVSSIMGMEYIKIVRNTKRLSIVVEKEMWIFLILVAILLIITLVSYVVWTKYKRSQRQKNLLKLQWRKKHLTW